MKSLLTAAAITLILSSSVSAFESGVRIACRDSVSGYKYDIKIVDIGDEEAYVRITRPGQSNQFYPSNKVVFDESDKGATFELLNNQGATVEGLFVDYSIENADNGESYYYDGGDSRAIECFLK